MKFFNQWIKEDKEINSTLNEKKTIVTVYDDKKLVFSDKEIKELLDQVLDKDDVIMTSDNLPGWLHKASLNNPDFPKSRKKIADFLQQILDSKKDVEIDVDSKKPSYLNNIIIENNKSMKSDNIEDFVKTLPKKQKHDGDEYELAMIADGDIYYINFEDGSDDNTSTLCYNMDMELLSANYHATNRWVSFLDKNKGEGYLWVSPNMKEQIELMREAGEFDQITESFTIASSLNEWLNLKENKKNL